MEVEAGVEDVADRGDEGVLVPDEGAGSEDHEEEIRVGEREVTHGEGGDLGPDCFGFLVLVFWARGWSFMSAWVLQGIVSGKKKIIRITAKPPRAIWSQKMTGQSRKLITTPPRNGPRAGPVRLPESSQPRAVARRLGSKMSPMAEQPTTRNGVSWKAVRTRKMKYAGRLGVSAVARLKTKNRNPLMINI